MGSTLKDLIDYFTSCTLQTPSGCANGTGLTAIYKKLFPGKDNIDWRNMAIDLSGFYSNPDNLQKIWRVLSDCERDFITYLIQYDRQEYRPISIFFGEKTQPAY